MTLRTAAGGALSRFAHLAGRAPARGKADVSDDEKDKGDDKATDESDDEEDKDTSSEEDEGEKDKKDSKAGKGAEEEDGDDKGDDEEEEDKPAASAARGLAAARRAERARCAGIFSAPEAAGNVALAAHLAFETDLPAAAAIGALRAAGTGGRRGLADRMAAETPPRLGADGGAGTPGRDTPEGNADFVLNAGRRPRGK
ncbi:hypothetical protein [Falsiroseomonas sp. CW058]|uniref:hypothetical protein n=1 Tax=Falsiroseomonas sp. CW058 TaxID=3388664 RepID=UPI003D317031